MRFTYAISSVLLVTVVLLLAGCGGGGNPQQQQTFLVTIAGRVANANTHIPVADASIAIGAYPVVTSGADGTFSVPDVQPAANILFQVTHADYVALVGSLTLDATTRTWSLTVGSQVAGQGALLEVSAGQLSVPSLGEAGSMVVGLTATGGGDGDDLPPGPPVWP